MQNAKPKPKKKGSEAEKGKENASEKEKAVPIESKDTEMAKPKNTSKRKATTDKDKCEKQVTKVKKSRSNDAKLAASKETAMQLFNCSENNKAEVTNVDKENHDVEELVLTNVQSTGNCRRDVPRHGQQEIPKILSRPGKCSTASVTEAVADKPNLSTTATSTCTANVAFADKSSAIPVPPTAPRSHHISKYGLVSQIVGELKTMNGTACNGHDNV